MTDVLAAEWLKLRTVVTTWYCVGLALAGVVLGTLLTFGMVSAYDGQSASDQATFTGTSMEEIAMLVAQLCLGVLGAIAVSSEYTTGMIRTTFVAMPGRRAVLAAKALVIGVTALVVGEIVVFATFLIGRAVVGDRPIPEFTSPATDEVAKLFGMGFTVVVVALVGLGLATLLRSATAAIAAIVVLIYVFPIAAGNIPAPLGPKIDAMSLKNLAFQVGGALPDPVLSPVPAFAVLAAYLAVPVAAAVYVIGRRDA